MTDDGLVMLSAKAPRQIKDIEKIVGTGTVRVPGFRGSGFAGFRGSEVQVLRRRRTSEPNPDLGTPELRNRAGL